MKLSKVSLIVGVSVVVAAGGAYLVGFENLGTILAVMAFLAFLVAFAAKGDELYKEHPDRLAEHEAERDKISSQGR